MGGKRERSGVTAISKNSIQITFTYKGVLCREQALNWQPTPANLKAGWRCIDLLSFTLSQQAHLITQSLSLIQPEGSNFQKKKELVTH